MKVLIAKKAIKLKKRFNYFLGSLDYLPYAEITVKEKEGLSGNGEIACAIDVNGEIDLSEINLVPYLNNILKNTTIKSEKDIIKTMNIVNLNVAFNAAAKCGLEHALYNILAQKKKTSLAAILGKRKEKVKIQANISFLESKKDYFLNIQEIIGKNPDSIKFKVGKNLLLESWAIKQLRSVNNKVKINIDANQAFASAKAALKFLTLVDNVDLSWAEQLIKKDDLEGWAELRKRAKVPLMADESVHTAADALLFMQNGWVDFINIKLAKSGGIVEARKIIKLARKYKVGLMLGSMLHGELGLKYNLAFALSEDFVTHGFYNYFSLNSYRLQKPLIDENRLFTTKYVYAVE